MNPTVAAVAGVAIPTTKSEPPLISTLPTLALTPGRTLKKLFTARISLPVTPEHRMATPVPPVKAPFTVITAPRVAAFADTKNDPATDAVTTIVTAPLTVRAP